MARKLKEQFGNKGAIKKIHTRIVSQKTRAESGSKGSYAGTASKGGQNLENLKHLLIYLSYLHSEGEISDRAFEALAQQAFSMCVEDSIQQKVNKFDSKLLELWSEFQDD